MKQKNEKIPCEPFKTGHVSATGLQIDLHIALKNAPLAIVVCGDPAKCDVWIEDCSIASILLHLAATDLGLGSCWIQLRLREFDEQQTAYRSHNTNDPVYPEHFFKSCSIAGLRRI